MRILLSAVLLLCSTLGACGGESTQAHYDAKVITVSSELFTFNDRTGKFVTFLSENTGECSITMFASDFKSGTQKRTDQPEGDIDISCLHDGDLFMLDQDKDTFAQVSVAGENKLEFSVSFNLRSPRTKNTLKADNILFGIK